MPNRSLLRIAAPVAWFLCSAPIARAQCDRWQQRILCKLDVRLDVHTHQCTGTEELIYWNNSPDTLRRVFFHLYFNAFQPGSGMDVRSRTIIDPDQRVGARIVALRPEEQGRMTVEAVMQEGIACAVRHDGTVLVVDLPEPILPGANTRLDLSFTSQVPVQIRRSGRDNKEGIAYSMSQWYPKICAYDQRGWHADPYVAREFYGEFGDHDLFITIDSSYTVAATGVLIDPEAIGHGYAPKGAAASTGGELTWHFNARNVHDLAWAADPDYVQDTLRVPGGPLLRFFHQDQDPERELWKPLPAAMVKSFQFMNEHFGRYPYPEYSFAQGGDGGMEYPMLTLISGQRNPIGVSVHESVHSWYYGVLASNEASYPWMDEGFTEYASSEVMRHLRGGTGDPHADAYEGYLQLAATPAHEPMSLHADHFSTNAGYSVAAYVKGELFLAQLRPVIGEKTLARGLLRYYTDCAFKHPGPVDVERALELVSGIELDWYFDEWINTTRLLDYAVDTLLGRGDSTVIVLERRGDMLMPLDVEVEGRDGPHVYHVPLSLMLGAKAAGSEPFEFSVRRAWQWTDPGYELVIAGRPSDVKRVVIDPMGRLADVDRANNAR